MARGRKSDPAEIQAAKGNPGKRKDTTVPVADLPALKSTAPQHLSAEAKKVWNTMVPKMQHSQLLRETDTGMLERYCETLSDFWDATRKLRAGKKGKSSVYEAETTNGGKLLRINPWFTVQERLSKRLESMEDRLGLNPRARQEIMHRLSVLPTVAPGDLFKDRHDGSSDGEDVPKTGVVGFMNQPTAGNA